MSPKVFFCSHYVSDVNLIIGRGRGALRTEMFPMLLGAHRVTLRKMTGGMKILKLLSNQERRRKRLKHPAFNPSTQQGYCGEKGRERRS